MDGVDLKFVGAGFGPWELIILFLSIFANI